MFYRKVHGFQRYAMYRNRILAQPAFISEESKSTLHSILDSFWNKPLDLKISLGALPLLRYFSTLVIVLELQYRVQAMNTQ